MKTKIFVLLFSAIGITAPAKAGVFADDLSRCLVVNTSDQDKVGLIRWMFSTVSMNPEVAEISAISQNDREKINISMGRLVQKLLTEKCREQTIAAVKNEGRDVFSISFEVLGKVAAQSMLSNPSVNEAAGAFTKHMDKKAFESLGFPGQ